MMSNSFSAIVVSLLETMQKNEKKNIDFIGTRRYWVEIRKNSLMDELFWRKLNFAPTFQYLPDYQADNEAVWEEERKWIGEDELKGKLTLMKKKTKYFENKNRKRRNKKRIGIIATLQLFAP